MHKGVDFLYEGVVNSIEAEAKIIKVYRKQNENRVAFKIVDNGKGFQEERLFEKGFSTKGDKRGLALSLLKEIDNNAKLERDDSFTTLSFTFNTLSLEEGNLPFTLALLYSRIEEEIQLTFYYDDTELVKPETLKDVEDIKTVKGIKETQQIIDKLIYQRSNKCQNSH